MTREDLRVAAKEKLQSCHNLAIQAGTGTGKSRVALEALQSLGTIKKLLIVVAERAHIGNWEDEINKWRINFDEVHICCYASLRKTVNTAWDGIIFDEAHHLNSSLRLELLNKINSKYNIFLSATLKDSLLYELESIKGKIESIKLGLQEAIDSSILPEPKIFLIPLILDNIKPTETIIEEWGKKEKRVKIECQFKDRWKYLRSRKANPDVTLTIHCTQRQKYDYISEQFEYYKKQYIMCRNEAVKNKWLQCGSKRKTYLGSLKTRAAYDILKTIEKKRYICFCTNIEQAEILGGENAIHSKKRNNLYILKNFNDGVINNLYAVGMLQEGQNLVDIDAGVIIQLDGEERSFIQRFGRVLRSDSPEQYILCYRNTRDEEYLNNALEGINKQYVKVLNYEHFSKRQNPKRI